MVVPRATTANKIAMATAGTSAQWLLLTQEEKKSDIVTVESNGLREEETSQLEEIMMKYSSNVMNTIAVKN